ncbi:polysaccharide pyruvyl transferase family protein [Nostoc edaphicum CCNP1411]|uniref:Polysaccharide pyruvyl transferase family protein n=1 Tax=Nostoc edaphicum CCNP1411 TaxID=1472755 RepID=A0A7D7LE73_9NOSO|nr:polysaccharide pyruvyl transferase family protein [Nostoc edaphicum]QMS91173.1 polysaccharide pyruvyl transferase family protein [Nostoc edaphicum CCNP1411]
MKIGIITFHHVDNYGATLQAYALWNFLNSQGYDVEIIDYRPTKIAWIYFRSLLPIKRVKININENKKIRINEKSFINISRAWKMRRFLLSNLKLSNRKVYNKKGLEYYDDKYDVIICGSDQIWCLDSFRGYNSSFFLDFVNNTTTRKISYAASFGNTIKLGDFQKEIYTLINQFQSISVRDSNSLKIITNECNKEAVKVLDPTFLIKYDALKSPPKIKDQYLLLYIQSDMETEEEYFIKLLAEEKNLTIVSVGKYNQLAQINLEAASPKEWIGLYSQASYIVTNTYHGAVFSIIFKKLFNVFVPNDKSNKVTDLLIDLGLQNRIFSDQLKYQILNKQIFDIDYKAVHEILESKILESKKYLVEAITQGVVDTRSNVECNKEYKGVDV